MKADTDLDRAASVASESRLYVGQFVRRQGQYGAVSVVARVGPAGVDVIDDARRLFPRDGLAETHGIVQHAGLIVGDWVEFDSVRNTRPRSHEYKVAHLRKLPRFADLSEMTTAECRALLTSEGWHGDRRQGLWALRLAGDKVVVTELEAAKSGALRLARCAARGVRLFAFDDGAVVHLRSATEKSDLFLDERAELETKLDWSDEADHVAQVIRSLSDANDPRIADLITWLDLHHEEGSGRVFAAAVNHDAAEAALRSGELAERLRADRSLMKAYLAAALEDGAVREAVAEYAREGHSEERIRLRAEFEGELAAARDRRLGEIELEAAAAREAAREKLGREMDELGDAERLKLGKLTQEIEAAHARRIQELESEFSERQAALEAQLQAEKAALNAASAAVTEAGDQLVGVQAEIADARSRLGDAKGDVDRMLAIADRLGTPNVRGHAVASPAMPHPSIGYSISVLPTVALADKGRLIGRQVLLNESGKDKLRSLIALCLAGEVPILFGSQAPDLVRFAEVMVSPGRFVAIEADPTLISVDDLWARPGSGAPTAIAAASCAAGEGGAVLAVIRGIERSGARFWLPALADALRGGTLPRGLLVCCIANEPDHAELAALPLGRTRIEVENILTDGAYMAAPGILSPSKLTLEALDPGPIPDDLSVAQMLLVELGLPLGVDQAIRVARVYIEAEALTESAEQAARVATDLARTIAQDSA